MSVLVTLGVMAAIYAIEATVEWFSNRNSVFNPSPSGGEKIADYSLMSEYDRNMIEETKSCISRMFGEPASDKIVAMTAEQRVEASTNLINELCSLYHISLDEVSYFSENSGNCGGYSHDKNKIELNIRYMMVNDPDCIHEYLDSIVHELRHAVQWSILEGKADWQTPEETQKGWLNNFVPWSHYVRPNQNRRRYVMQPVERDAFTFAHYALEGVK